MLETAIDGIKAEVLLDATVIDSDGSTISATVTDEDTILDHMRAAFKKISKVNRSAIYGDADRSMKPVFALNTDGYTAYQLAVADAETTTYEGVEKGLFKAFLGMEVVHYAPLADTEMLVTPISNLVLATDDYADSLAIQTEYDKKTNSDNVWGQYKIGFLLQKR